jgi:hypothetical protein
MRNRRKRGSIIIEFSLVTVFFMVPMMLGTYAIGFNLLQQLEVVQFTRDAGHLYVTLNYGQQMSLTDPTFLTILGQVGAQAGYPSSAGVIFAKVMYVDQSTCGLGGGTGTPPSCNNSGKWVFTQYYRPVGQALPSGFTSGVPLPSGGSGTYSYGAYNSQGDFYLADSVKVAGLVASGGSNFLGITSYNPDAGSGLPSGQTVFYVEVGATGISVPGVVSVPALNDRAFF